MIHYAKFEIRFEAVSAIISVATLNGTARTVGDIPLCCTYSHIAKAHVGRGVKSDVLRIYHVDGNNSETVVRARAAKESSPILKAEWENFS